MAQKGLGKGLEALIPTGEHKPGYAQAGEILTIPIKKIKPNKYQPRTHFNEEKLNELADSIREKGIIQPLLVSESAVPGEYELIAGERRLRAAERADLVEVPAVLRHATEQDKYQLSLIENLQREDLNPIEEAVAYKNIAEEFDLTQEKLAQLLGYDRSVIANTLRLLTLSESIRDMIAQGIMSLGHGRVLAGISNKAKQNMLADKIIHEKLTVREIENIAKDWKSVTKTIPKKKRRLSEVVDLENSLQKKLGTKVQILSRGKKGKIVLYFWSVDEFNKLLNILKSEPKRKR